MKTTIGVLLLIALAPVYTAGALARFVVDAWIFGWQLAGDILDILDRLAE